MIVPVFANGMRATIIVLIAHYSDMKLALGVDLYRHQLDFDSPNNIYTETRTGARVSLTRALGSDFLIGSVSYAIEDVGISLNDGWHDFEQQYIPPSPPLPGYIQNIPPNVPSDILNQTGDHLFHRFGASIAAPRR